MEQVVAGRQLYAMPNLITLSRVGVGVLVPFVWYWSPSLVVALVLWAGISDFLDGWTARQWNSRTPLGVVGDPLADKLFVAPVLCIVAIAYGGVVLWALCILTVLYDIDNTYRRRIEIIAAFQGRYAAQSRPVTWLSKGKTAVLFGFLFLVTLAPWFPQLDVHTIALVPLCLVGLSWWQSRKSTFFP